MLLVNPYFFLIFPASPGLQITIFRLMDEPILDAFRGILRQRLYVAGSYVQKKGGPIEKMVFIVRGQMKSTGSDGNTSILREGHVCGEELLAWHLENVSVNRGGSSNLVWNALVASMELVIGSQNRPPPLRSIYVIYRKNPCFHHINWMIYRCP